MKKSRTLKTLWISGIVITTALGITGYNELFGDQISISSIIYKTITLFTFGGDVDNSNLPLTLDISRFLGMFLIATALINAVFLSSKNFFLRLYIKLFSRRKVVFFGIYNEMISLILEVMNFDRIIVITDSDSEIDVPIRMRRKIKIIRWELYDDRIFSGIGISNSIQVFFTYQDDRTNQKILNSFRAYISRNPPKKFMRVFLHQFDHFNYSAYRDLVTEWNNENIDYRSFNLYNQIAISAVDKFAPDRFTSLHGDNDPAMTLVIVGFGFLGQLICKEALVLYHFGNLRRSSIVIIDEEIDDKKSYFEKSFPQASEIADITFLHNLPTNTSQDSSNLLSKASICFVCGNTSQEIYELSTRLRQALLCSGRESHVPHIASILLHDDGISDLLVKRNPVMIPNFALEAINASELLLWEGSPFNDNELYEQIAKEIHILFCTNSNNKHLPDWVNLSNAQKDMNRYAARHLFLKLRMLGLCIAPHGKSEFVFDYTSIDELTVERIAKCEHNRWLAEKRMNGYFFYSEDEHPSSYKMAKEYIKGQTNLVEWESLSDDERSKDIFVLKGLNQIFDKLGVVLVKSSQ